MSEPSNQKYDSLCWTEDEVDQAVRHRDEVFSHPDMDYHHNQLNKEQTAYVRSRHWAVNQVVHKRFVKMLGDRGLAEKSRELRFPGLFPDSEPMHSEANVAWFKENAPDLTDEYLAYQDWRNGRSAQWKELWKLEQEKAEASKA